MRDSTQIVIIGGGIIGCSIAYHLTKMGWQDVVLLEKGELTSGSTWHAAGLVGQLRSERNITRMLQYSVNLYEQLEEETGLNTGWNKCGCLHLASTKERIYELKKTRRQLKGDFVEVNCATLRGDAAMSALFGHKKGAFTGATQDRNGLLRAADRGMLLLDEVGELGLDEQSMLLRAIEEKSFLPVGSDKETESDFQLICGTNRDLQIEVANGRFREDLLSRINLWTFHMPGRT